LRIAPGHILHEASEPAVGLGEITTEKNGIPFKIRSNLRFNIYKGKVQGTSTRVKQIAELFEKSGIKVTSFSYAPTPRLNIQIEG